MLQIAWQDLSDAAFAGLLESVVLREGTDYGVSERSFADKVAGLRQSVVSGRAVIVFDAISESCTIVPVEDLRQWADA